MRTALVAHFIPLAMCGGLCNCGYLCYIFTLSRSATHTSKQESPPAWMQVGIPTVACPVLHGGSCPGGGAGYPGWVPPGWGTPILTWLGGTPGRCPLARVPPILTWLGGEPGQAPSSWGTSHPSWPSQGVTPGGHPWLAEIPPPDLARGYPRWVSPGRGTPLPQLDLAGVPPPTVVDWQTKWNYNLLSRTTYVVSK